METGLITMRNLAYFAMLLTLGAPVHAMPPVPRQSPEFTIVEPSGKKVLLSSFKGKVVMIEFLLTNCPHCQRVSQMITGIHGELGPRGFQPLGIAFNPGIIDRMVIDFVQQFGVTYPIGCSTSDAVDSYLGRSAMDRVIVPQIVVIDRNGVIRAQSPAKGDPNLETRTCYVT
jgi:peroxiredoxin